MAKAYTRRDYALATSLRRKKLGAKRIHRILREKHGTDVPVATLNNWFAGMHPRCMRTYPKHLVKNECDECGKQFSRWPCALGNYCSRTCYWKSMRGKKQPRYLVEARARGLMGHATSETARRRMSAGRKRYLAKHPAPSKPLRRGAANLTKRLARVLGWVAGDGHVDHVGQRLVYVSSSEKLAREFGKECGRQFGIAPIVRKNKNWWNTWVYSKKAVDLVTRLFDGKVRHYCIDMPTALRGRGMKACRREFIRCLYGDDGSVTIDGKKIYVRMALTSPRLVRHVERALREDYGIDATLSERKRLKETQHDALLVQVARKDSVARFCKRVGFHPLALVVRGRWAGEAKQRVLEKAVKAF
jgi:hypothetical protein